MHPALALLTRESSVSLTDSDCAIATSVKAVLILALSRIITHLCRSERTRSGLDPAVQPRRVRSETRRRRHPSIQQFAPWDPPVKGHHCNGRTCHGVEGHLRKIGANRSYARLRHLVACSFEERYRETRERTAEEVLQCGYSGACRREERVFVCVIERR